MKTCQISAVRLDGVPVSSAAAESCGKVFRAKILSAEIRSYPSKGKKRQIDGEIFKSSYWFPQQKANLFMLFFLSCFFFPNKGK